MSILKNKYINWFSVVLFAQIAVGLGFFLYGYLRPEPNNEVTSGGYPPIGIDALASYLRLIIGNTGAIATKISLHNFALAIIAYILNIFTFGLSGPVFLAQSCFLFALTLKQNQSPASVAFVALEMVGVFVACGAGVYIPYKRHKSGLAIKKILLFSLAFVIFLSAIYWAAAFIESSIIKTVLN
jgi:hypothetical protein